VRIGRDWRMVKAKPVARHGQPRAWLTRLVRANPRTGLPVTERAR
jgi:hypothetical protein